MAHEKTAHNTVPRIKPETARHVGTVPVTMRESTGLGAGYFLNNHDLVVICKLSTVKNAIKTCRGGNDIVG